MKGPPTKPATDLRGGWICCLDRADRHHSKNCVFICVCARVYIHAQVLFALADLKDLCHVDNNVSSQDFNGNIISCLFVLSFPLNVFSLPAVIQYGEKHGMKKRVEFDQLKNSLLVGKKEEEMQLGKRYKM